MAPTIRTVARGFAALFSSLVLLGPMTFVFLVAAPELLVDATGLTVPEPLAIGWIVSSAVVALWLGIEGAAVQLYGLGILDRGGPRQRTARYSVIGLTALAGLVVIAQFLAMAIPWAIDTGSLSAQVLGVAVVVALVASLYRTAAAARRGYVNARTER